jgi:hypothetical protein
MLRRNLVLASSCLDTDLHVDVRRLGQHTSALQEQTQVPRGPPSGAPALIDHNSIKQTPPAHELDKR